MIRYIKDHAANDSGAWAPADGVGGVLTHTAQALSISGTITGTASLYGTNDPMVDAVGTLICSFAFTAAASGDRATPVFSEHTWEYVRSEVSGLSGSGAGPRIRITVSGS